MRIETEAACRIAAAAMGKNVYEGAFVVTNFLYPRGCYYDGNDAYFNTHAVGNGYPGFRLLCATVTTGAPPSHADARARAPMPRRVRCTARARSCGRLRQQVVYDVYVYIDIN